MMMANRITFSRFGITVLLLPFFYLGTELGYFTALVLFVLAVCTDVADGYIARFLGQASAYGASLDALVDKILIYALLFSLFNVGIYKPSVIFSMFFRDMIVDGLRNRIYEIEETSQSNVWGKSKFALQSLSICLGLLHCVYPTESTLIWLANGALIAALVVSLPGLWAITLFWMAASRNQPGRRLM
jgi:CDP-diacylglycerol--glycerol-3-phosphate 3-phosphatidyltransferase